MATRHSLSVLQQNSLELTFVSFKATQAFIESIQEKLTPDELFIARNLLDLSELAEHKVGEAFPQLFEWIVCGSNSISRGDSNG
jgi:hypothetical protein